MVFHRGKYEIMAWDNPNGMGYSLWCHQTWLENPQVLWRFVGMFCSLGESSGRIIGSFSSEPLLIAGG